MNIDHTTIDPDSTPRRADYFWTAPAVSDEQRAYLSRHGICYSAPGQCAGIRQYEAFDGTVNTVNVHPFYPATPERVEGCAATWRTSDRRAAVRLASADATLPAHKTGARGQRLGYGDMPATVAGMVAAAQQVTAFLARWVVDGAVTTGDGYDTDAETMFDAVCLTGVEKRPGNVWCEVWAKAMVLRFRDRAAYVIDRCARKIAGEIGSYLRRLARDGWMPFTQAYDLSMALETAAGMR